MDDHISSFMTHTRFHRREFSEPHNLYQDEIMMLNAIRTGDIELAREALKQPAHGTPGQLSEDPLRSAKNLLIARLTTVSRAAIEGGLSNEESFTMSDAYILQGEHCRTIPEVWELGNQAVLAFTSAVAAARAHTLSPVTEKAMDYISKHLHYPVTLEELAEQLKISPAYLSRLFHRETGLTLVSYIQKERIQAAKNMLRFSDYSYMEIATYLNFKSQSYFGMVFKKFTGMTPRQYRQSKSEDVWRT